MADNVTTTITPVTPDASTPTPITPVVASTPAPVTPAVETSTPAPVVEVIPPKESTSVLGDAIKAAEPTVPPVEPVKPVEATAETPVVESEVKVDEPIVPPTYDAFKLPDNIVLDDARLKDFTDILSDFEGKTKAQHEAVQEFGQKAVDFHVAEVQKAVEAINKNYQDSWENTKNEWKETFLKDPELGGNRWQTTINSALSFVRTHGGTPEQQTEFRQLMDMSGIGNHPAMIRLLANAGRNMQEGKPLAASTPVTAPKSKVATMYGGS